MTTEAPLYRVHLLDEATVVERGERVRVWFAPLGDTWVRAADCPTAEVELSSSERGDRGCPPGTIWQRSVELSLPKGSYLLARTTSPLHVKLEPMEYFRKGRFGMQRSVHETWMRVVGNYRLERVDAAPASYVDALEPPSR